MPNQKVQMELKRVISRMNEILKLKRGFKVGTKRTKPLEARLKDYSADQIIECLDWLWYRWRKWDQRRNYFNPTTVFRTSNWERYFEDFEIAKSEDSEKMLRTVPNERKSFIGKLTFEEYLKCVMGASQFIRAQYMRLEPIKKREYEKNVRKSFEQGIDPEKVNSISFFAKSA